MIYSGKIEKNKNIVEYLKNKILSKFSFDL